MSINPELVARAYAIYEYFINLTDSVSSGRGSSRPSSISSKSDSDLKEFIDKIKAMDKEGDDDGDGDGDTAKGLRGDEQLREARSLKMM